MNVKKTMEHVVDNSTACGLREARPHPEDHPPRAPELGEGAAGMELTVALWTTLYSGVVVVDARTASILSVKNAATSAAE